MLTRILTLLLTALLLLGSHTAAALPTPDAEGVVQGSDGPLYWHSYGSGPLLLVLNGGPGVSSAHFGNLARQLAQLDGGRRVILFDQRGTGRSTLEDLSGETVNLERMVADVEALRTAFGIERWDVFGHSWGGMYAMLYGVAHPERVDGLVLSASGGVNMEWADTVGANLRSRLGPDRRATYEHWIDPANASADPATANLERVRAMAPAYVYHPENMPFVVEALTREGANFPEVRTLVYADLRRTRYDLREPLGAFDRPTLVLSGRQDFLGEATPLGIRDTIPGAELVWLEECAHYPWLDAPEAYFGAIDAFLQRHARTAASG
jgi:proline iminopeptidase